MEFGDELLLEEHGPTLLDPEIQNPCQINQDLFNAPFNRLNQLVVPGSGKGNKDRD